MNNIKLHQKEAIEISIVVPLYNCRNSIIELTTRLSKVFQELAVEGEIILVNDASPQNDWEIVRNVISENHHVRGINLSRNFGQHAAIFCGLQHAKGAWVVVMDGDLQDVPEEIVKLYQKAKEGYDIVFAKRVVRQDSLVKRFGSKLFYKVLGYLTETKQDSTIANFGIYKATTINAVLQMKDYVKYFPTMTQWIGFKKTAMAVEHAPNADRDSSYNFKSLLSLGFNCIVSFSNKPLKLVIKFGFCIVLLSLLMAFYYVFKYFNGDTVVLGYSSLIVSIWFLSGCMISILGIIGIYLGKVFEKVKDRPVYIINEVI